MCYNSKTFELYHELTEEGQKYYWKILINAANNEVLAHSKIQQPLKQIYLMRTENDIR